MERVFSSIVSWAIKKRIHQIELFIKHPIEVQKETFLKLIKEAKNTAWGKKYDYNSISSIAEFQERVPISSYENIYPWIEKMMKGEQNLLWGDEINWFSKSSGTTNAKSKYIPVSKKALEDCHYKGGKDLISIYLNNNPNSKLFAGKSLVLGGSYQKHENQTNIFVGDVSAVIMQNLPLWAEWVRTPNLETALLSDYETKLQRIMEESIKKNVTSLAGVPTWTAILLQRIVDKTKSKSILDIWPNLEAFFHGGVNFAPYKSLFKELIPKSSMNYIDSYNASEGYFGIQIENKADDMLLMLDYGIFYEFIPMSDFENENAKALTLEEVQKDVNYAVMISTNAGLWRYIIGDTIKFTSINPFKFKITGRTKHFINAFGEELIIEDADTAIAIACEQTNAKLNNYTAAPIYLENNTAGAHQWLIEFEQVPKSIEQFTEILDNELKKLNSDYEAKRSGNIALISPKILVLPPESFYKWMKHREKLGGQNKVPRLSNNRDFVESIIQVLDIKH